MSQQRVITPDAKQWEALVHKVGGHLLQTDAWGQLKDAFGWDVERVALANADGELVSGAQVLYRPLPLGLGTLAYVPRGPVGEWDEALLAALDERARKRRAVMLKLEPDEDDSHAATARLRRLGLRPGLHSIQPRRSLLVDLSPGEEQILASMAQKTRYNVRLGPKKDIAVRRGQTGDLPSFINLMEQTGQRDSFGVHSPEYYRSAYYLFSAVGSVALLLASFEGKDLAGLMAFRAGKMATYLYGASSNEERNRMPTYTLQWEAMRWAKQHGCTTYDLWGVPDANHDELEATFAQRSDDLWGVYRFKRGFGGRLVRTVGAWDGVYNPVLYMLYRLVVRGRE